MDGLSGLLRFALVSSDETSIGAAAVVDEVEGIRGMP